MTIFRQHMIVLPWSSSVWFWSDFVWFAILAQKTEQFLPSLVVVSVPNSLEQF